MNYKEKAEYLKRCFFKENGVYSTGSRDMSKMKWSNLEALSEYLQKFDGRIKFERKRRKGYIVTELYINKQKKPVCAEVPVDFAEKIMVLGGFP